MKRLLGLALTTLSLAACPSTAQAGQYEVKACYGPNGPGQIDNASWWPEISSEYATAYTHCAGDGITTRMSGGSGLAPYGSGARYTFTTPAETRVIGIRASFNITGYYGWYAGIVDTTPRWVLGGGLYTTWDQWWTLGTALNTWQVYAQVTCGDPNGCRRDVLTGFVKMRDVLVTVQDDAPPAVSITGGSVTAGGWRNGNQDVQYSASDSTGIRQVDVLVDGRKLGSGGGACSEATARPCQDLASGFPLRAQEFGSDGRHQVAVTAYDGGWNPSTTSREVFVDRTAPAQPLDLRLEGENDWRSRNAFSLTWRNAPQDASPIVAARYEICPAATDPGNHSSCTNGRSAARDIVRLADVRVPHAGDWRIKVWLEDQAGNADSERSVTLTGLQFDEAAPSLTILPPSENDPTRVRVSASDDTSGVAQGQIEARRRGEDAWRSLPTILDPKGFSAILDDETLPPGRYQLRARAVDRAGNERSTEEQQDGTPAVWRLPLRLRTRLVVGKPKRVRANGSHGHRRYRTILIVRPRATYGRTIPLRGRVTTPGGNPLADAAVEVSERIELPTAEWRRVAVVKTTRTGRFRFKALRGPSRSLRFRYPGTATIRARSKVVDLGVRAVTSLRVNRRVVVNGEEVTFRGRLKGRQRAAAGKLVNLQVYTRGRWATFATPRANPGSGAWKSRYRFTATRGRVRYRFRALVPKEASYPYETGVSRSVRVTVRGL